MHFVLDANNYFIESNKEIAPRFKKNLILPKEEIEGLELRPNSMLFNKASVKTNNIMNTRTIEPNFTHAVKQPPAPLHKEPLPIKQVSSEKPKQSKKDKVCQFSLEFVECVFYILWKIFCSV